MENQKNFVKWLQIIITVIFIIGLILMWAGIGTLKINNSTQPITLGNKIVFTLISIILLSAIWIAFFYQQRNDQLNQENNKAFSTLNKLSGWGTKIESIGNLIKYGIINIIIIIFGIFLSISLNNLTFLLISLVGLIILIMQISGFLIAWKRSKSLVKGRYY